MRSKWYVHEVMIDGRPAYIAAYTVNSFKNVLRRNMRTCGGFSRNREAVERLVEALNQNDREYGRI